MVDRVQESADRIVAALAAGELRPILSAESPLDLDSAYEIQAKVVAQSGMTIAGFKAALSNEAGQKALGVSEPVFGVLPKAGEGVSGGSFNLGDLHGPVIETEIGYRVGAAISAPVTPEAVWDYLDKAIPVFEIADPAFAPDGSRTGADLVAVNSAAAAFVPGDAAASTDDLDAVRVVMSRDDEKLSEGVGTDAMGGQIQAVCWLINKAVAHGYTLEPGQLLMTGALGGPQPGQPGHYVGDYGAFGRIEFDLI